MAALVAHLQLPTATNSTLNPEEAARIFAVPMPRNGKKSLYIRFKSLMAKDAKAEGKDAPTTKETKDAWNRVSGISSSADHKENPGLHRLLRFKEKAEQEDAGDKAAVAMAKLEWVQAVQSRCSRVFRCIALVQAR
jgi:hypothetical protein